MGFFDAGFMCQRYHAVRNTRAIVVCSQLMGARPIGSHGHYPAKHFDVPRAVARAAREGLELRKQYERGGTDVGIARARQLSSGSPRVTLRDIVYIRSYLRRHVVDNLGEKNPPSNGWIAWQLWGGWPAKKWAESIFDEAKRKGWIVRKNPTPVNHDAFLEDVNAAIRGFVGDARARALLREHKFLAWDNGGCLALQQALLLFFEDALERDPSLEAAIEVQPAYVMSPGVTEHALVWVDRVGGAPVVIDSTGVKPAETSASEWQHRMGEYDRELMTVMYDQLPEDWYRQWRERIADEYFVLRVRQLLEEHFMKTQQKNKPSKLEEPRSNPFDSRGMPTGGGREPYIFVRCVNGVIESKLDKSGKRAADAADVSSAHAICTSRLQKRGIMHKGSHDLTKKGERENELAFHVERGEVAHRRLHEYEGHLATAKSKTAPRRNPSSSSAPTTLMRVAAPLIAGNDPGRLEEAGRIMRGETMTSALYRDEPWSSLVEARRNLSKVIALVDREVSHLGMKPYLLVTEAIRQRALDRAADRDFDKRHGSLLAMIEYLAYEYDALLAFWALADLMIIFRLRDPRLSDKYRGLQPIVDWAYGSAGAAAPAAKFPIPTEAPDAVIALLKGANYVAKYNAVNMDTIIAAQRDLIANGPVSSREELSKMAAERLVATPPFLLSDAFKVTRRSASSFHRVSPIGPA